MSTLTWIMLFSLIGGVLSVVGAAGLLILPERFRLRFLPHLVSFAIGALLGAAFLALLPHALSAGVTDVHNITGTVLIGILGFFVLEKLVLWRHCHHAECEAHPADFTGGAHAHHEKNSSSGILLLFGDAFHNFVDGVLIAAAFLTDVELGIVTALAVAAHEVPQEVGDFAVLLESGFSRAKAFLFNILSSLTTVVGALLAYYSLSGVSDVVPFILAIAAASFIYIAVADLIPGLHKRTDLATAVQQLVLIVAGMGVIYLAHSTLH